eukprot:4837926-Alexandrium_andersonii.AAC.1
MAGARGPGLGCLWHWRRGRRDRADVREHGPAGGTAQLVELVVDVQPKGVASLGADGILQNANRL